MKKELIEVNKKNNFIDKGKMIAYKKLGTCIIKRRSKFKLLEPKSGKLLPT